jgi:protein ImuB
MRPDPMRPDPMRPDPMRPDPMRIVSIWFPDWPVTAAGFAADGPAAVMRANRVVARTAAAAAEGVAVGQRRRQAQRLCPHITLVEHDPDRDAREFDPFVRAVGDLSPRLDVIEPGWISLQARGPSRYVGGDDALAERLGAIAAGGRWGTPGVGIADGRFPSSVAARLAVRRGRPVTVRTGGSPEFCADLPIGWLQTLGECDPDLVELFVRLGLRRLGDLAALDAVAVLGRFGHAGVHAHRLASGDDARPASTTDPAPERRLDHVLDDPAEHTSAVVFIAKQLADELATALAADGRVCTRLVVLLESEHGERSERSWYRPAGLTAPAMVERVRWQLDAWVNLPRGSAHELTGGVTLVRLTPDEVRSDHGIQLGLWGGQSDADRRAARAVARLTTLTSPDAVTVPVWRGGRLPADRYDWIPAALVDLDQRASATAAPGSTGPWPGALPSPSPATVFSEPQPVEVLDEHGEVVVVTGRGQVSAPPAALRQLIGDDASGWRRGSLHRIVAWAGPWPLEERWWEPERHRRLARLQLVTGDRDGAGDHDGYLVVAEHRRWWISARYD